MSLLHKSDLSGKPIDGETCIIQVGYKRTEDEIEQLVKLALSSGRYEGMKKDAIRESVILDSLVVAQLEVSKDELEEFKQKYFA